jgi:hypothetical protein
VAQTGAAAVGGGSTWNRAEPGEPRVLPCHAKNRGDMPPRARRGRGGAPSEKAARGGGERGTMDPTTRFAAAREVTRQKTGEPREVRASREKKGSERAAEEKERNRED